MNEIKKQEHEAHKKSSLKKEPKTMVARNAVTIMQSFYFSHKNTMRENKKCNDYYEILGFYAQKKERKIEKIKKLHAPDKLKYIITLIKGGDQ